jgi:thiol-disulfide isomerase/thioredoxin
MRRAFFWKKTSMFFSVQKISRLLLPIYYIVSNVQASAQVSTIAPAHASWGDTLRIHYHLRDTSAALSGKEPVYVRIVTWQQDGGYNWKVLRMEGKDTLKQSFVLPPAAASCSIRFYTLNKDDDKAARKLYVYAKGTQQPVAGAYWDDFFSADPRTPFEKEIQHHPQHYLTYAKYFNVVSMYKGIEESRQLITTLLSPLEKAYREQAAPRADLCAALCVGYAKTGRLPEAKTYLLKLFDAFPQAEATLLAFSLYNYEYYKASSKQIEDDVRQQLARIYVQYPNAALTGDGNVTYYLSKLPALTVVHFERALLPRYAQESIPYYALDKLPEIYIDRKEKLDSAKAMLIRFIRQWQEGSINHQFRLSSGHYSMYVPYLLQKLSEANLLLQEYNEAVTNASAAIALLTGSNYEGNLLPEILAIRARAYRKAGNLDMALEDYKQLYKDGKEEALDSIKAIFPYCTVKEKSAEALAASLRKKAAASTAAITLAPDFTVKDLQGNTIRLTALKGKVVVVNFWGTGCGPCIGEMPALNKLVQKYRSNSNVVFLAITGDETARLQQFFKKRTFLYTVVNNGGKVNDAYQIESLPVHIVIGKDGAIINRSTGAREDIGAYLDGVIQRVL